MKRKKRDVIAKLVQKQGKNGMYMIGTLEGGKLPIVLFKSSHEKNEGGDSVWNLYIDK